MTLLGNVVEAETESAREVITIHAPERAHRVHACSRTVVNTLGALVDVCSNAQKNQLDNARSLQVFLAKDVE